MPIRFPLCAGLLLGALLTPPASLLAQSHQLPLERALETPPVEEAQRHVATHRRQAAERLVQIGQIQAPSGQERERARAVRDLMQTIGLSSPRVDDINNAIGIVPGTTDSVVVFISTLDDLATVAEHQAAAEAPPRIEDDRVVGPGTNTSSTTVAMLTAAEALLDQNLRPRHTLVFAAVAQEETGLRGMRKVYEDYRDRAVAFIDVLGDGSSISYGALAIHWWRVEASGPGGHTLRGGLPNINQGIGRAVDRILRLPHPERHDDQNTRLNISVIESGEVFNHKPKEGWFSLDLRSLDPAVVTDMERAVDSVLATTAEETGIEFERVPETLVPGGQIPGLKDSDLVQSSAAIARRLDLTPELSPVGSSNMNIAIAGGTPAIGLGGDRGGQARRPRRVGEHPRHDADGRARPAARGDDGGHRRGLIRAPTHRVAMRGGVSPTEQGRRLHERATLQR